MASYSDNFRVFAASIANALHPSLPIAASRAGHVGILDLEYVRTCEKAGEAIVRLAEQARGHWGLKLRAADAERLLDRDCEAALGAGTIVVTGGEAETLGPAIAAIRRAAPQAEVLVELIDHALLAEATRAGADGLVLKGNDAGGRVGDETAFMLLARLAPATSLPLIAHGGVGPDSVAAFRAAGAAGVLLDWQLALFDEAETPEPLAAAVRRMDGSETRCLGVDQDVAHRVYWRPDRRATLALAERVPQLDAAAFSKALRERVDPLDPEGSIWLTGQDAAFAGTLRARHPRLREALNAIRDGAADRLRLAAEVRPLAKGGPLAAAHGTEFPIAQGPMTRVSDRAAFALVVGEGGALPFLALALMRRPQIDELMVETRQAMDGRPWGVGILGFVDDALREEQMAAVADARPDYALIAGGRPEQAAALERAGIPTYLHVPSPGLLGLFLESGVRRFVFEGRECGGHVGPRSSAVLWQQAIDGLVEHFGPEGPIDCDVLFAGGVHDALSAAMVSAMAAGIARRGARIGVLMGTAYVLTEEAVASGAIVEDYQSLVLEAERTVLLESGPGHVTRVVDSPIVAEFRKEKARLHAEGVEAEEIRERLERFNVGRLRIASKGIDRNPDHGRVEGAERYRTLDPDERRELGVYMIGQAAALHDAKTTIADLHKDVCTVSGALLERLAAALPAPAEAVQPVPEPMNLAITGIGTMLPKARDLAEFWQNILDKVDAIEEVPARRWDWRRYFNEDRDAPDKIYSRWGGFLDEVEFDPLRYGIPPNSVPLIEPLQILALETVRQALENAGFPDGVIEDAELRRRTSVIIGVGGGTGPLGQRYAVRASMPAILGDLPPTAAERLPDWSEDSFPGVLLNVIAGRITNRFDLGGVNFTVDAACGSSLAAVLAAARELENGTSDMVIVGGADSFQNPFDFVAFSKTRALSPRGRCRTFDASADGIAISEGLAMMVLRRLEDAEASGDRIYALLQGIAGSSDGRDLSLTAPRPEGQEAALTRAYARAGFSPGTVGLVEAHGTGTVVGDRTEIASLGRVFGAARDEKQFCGVGSVKSMIGHTKAAAGCAGLAKIALALHHKVLPPTLHVETPNPEANFPESPFYVLSEARPWLAGDGAPRRAGVSAFGFGGTNFHAVLEEYRGGYLARHREPLRRGWTDELYLFSAGSPEALSESLTSAASALANAPRDLRPENVAASLAKHFDPAAPARFAMVAGSLAELADRLATAAPAVANRGKELRAVDPKGAFFAAEEPLDADAIGFLFPGQGSQYPNMLADLAIAFPEVRETFERATRLLEGRLSQPLGELVFPRPALDPDEAAAQAEALKQTDAAQPAIGAASIAMLDLLGSFGLKPAALAGHSFGEFTALHAAGTMTAEALIDLANRRGDAMIRAGGDDLGAMAAVSAGADAVQQALAGAANVTLANLNAPDQTVIAGPTPAVEAAAERLAKAGIAAKRLPVACGFHSPCVAPARDLLEKALAEADLAAPSLPVYANASATAYPADAAAVRARLTEHLVEPVNFLGTIRAMYEAGTRLFVEVGPGAVLTRLVERTLAGRPYLALASDIKDRSGIRQLLCLLGGASAAGVPLRLDRLWQGRASGYVDVVQWRLAPPANPRRATLWMIDAANARPIDSEPPRKGFAARIEEDPMPSPATTAKQPATSGAPAAAPVQGIPVSPLPAAATQATQPQAPLPTSGPRSDLDAIVCRHQELMARLIDSNRDVMLAWLGAEQTTGASLPALSRAAGNGLASLPADPSQAPSQPLGTPGPQAPVVAKMAGAPDPVQPVTKPQAAGTPPPQPSAPAIDRAGVMAKLLALISDRTGYPPEMLDPDINLEADLGIDSIKRVEILGALRLHFLPEAGEAARERMGPVSRQRTANGIVDSFMEVVGAFSAAPTTAEASALPEGPSSSAVQPSDVPAPDSAGVMAALLELISERTGYPPEMLDPDINLEADLGIDSIKRVEILGALRLRFLPEAGEAARERMGPVSQQRTAATIVEKFLEVVGAFSGATAAEAPVDTPAVAVQQATPSPASDLDTTAGPLALPRLVMTPRPLGAPAEVRWVVPGGIYVVTDDGEGVAERLAREIEGRGGVARLIGVEEAATFDQGSAARLAGEMGAGAAGLIHCRPLRAAVGFGEATAAAWQAEIAAQTRAFFLLLSALGPALSTRSDAVVMTASASGGAFGFDGEVVGGPFFAGPVGLLKTLAKEWQGVHCRAVDFDRSGDTDERASLLAAEAGRRDEPVEIGYVQGQRTALFAEARPLGEQGEPALQLGPESVVLVTGGARGITAQTVEQLAKGSRARFVLVGSTPTPAAAEDPATAAITDSRALKAALIAAVVESGAKPQPAAIEAEHRALMKAREIRAALAAVAAAGGQAEYLSCDVCDAARFGALIDDIYARYGRIDAVIHGAGLIEDKLVLDKAPDSFDRVVRTKTDSAFTLARHLRPETLSALVFFTSVAGRFGNRGQGDYAAANETVSKLARELDAAWPGRVVAISWGPWDSAGMVSAEVRAQFSAIGIEPIDPALGVRALEVELTRGAKGEPEVVWGAGPWQMDEARYASQIRPGASEAAE